jgi:formylglycine-generating enzyme required for sulfatase activity
MSGQREPLADRIDLRGEEWLGRFEAAGPLSVHSDHPDPHVPHFGFEEMAVTMAALISSRANRTPFTIGVHGPWGRGKTSLMEAIRLILDGTWGAIEQKFGQTLPQNYAFRPAATIWFDAWKYREEEALLAVLFMEIVHQLSEKGFVGLKINQAVAELKTQHPFTLLQPFISLLTAGKVNVGELAKQLPLRTHLPFLWVFHQLFRAVLPQDDQKVVLVIFIDDLDRCPPVRIIQVLEAVKLVLGHPGVVTVLGLDADRVEEALALQYQGMPGFDARRYLAKLFQHRFSLPPIRDVDVEKFVQALDPDGPLSRYVTIVSRGIEKNPREVKLLVNFFRLARRLAVERKLMAPQDREKEALLAKWAVLDFAFARFMNVVKERALFLLQAQEEARRLRTRTPEPGIEREKGEETSEQFREFFVNPRLVEVLALEPHFADEGLIRDLTFVAQTAAPSAPAPVSTLAPPLPGKLPTFVTVPAGKFLMGEARQAVEIPHEYRIGIYPVTNAQYAEFVKATKRNPPEHWQGGECTSDVTHHPVVNVSRHDANTYCDWLSARLREEGRLRDGEVVRLPTEMEWEKAARGTDGREYPWGNEFDPKKANTRESGIGSTTPVGQFPEGISPYGCYDMAGNVLEWCENLWGEDPASPPKTGAHRSLRGGSWRSSAHLARCASRSYYTPGLVFNHIGFRCVGVPHGSP